MFIVYHANLSAVTILMNLLFMSNVQSNFYQSAAYCTIGHLLKVVSEKKLTCEVPLSQFLQPDQAILCLICYHFQ
jgi:hypothetical protein